MATKNEYPEKKEWWINELDSLGMRPEITNELYDTTEIGKHSYNEKIGDIKYHVIKI